MDSDSALNSLRIKGFRTFDGNRYDGPTSLAALG